LSSTGLLLQLHHSQREQSTLTPIVVTLLSTIHLHLLSLLLGIEIPIPSPLPNTIVPVRIFSITCVTFKYCETLLQGIRQTFISSCPNLDVIAPGMGEAPLKVYTRCLPVRVAPAIHQYERDSSGTTGCAGIAVDHAAVTEEVVPRE
jgi:hypothetical protein